MGLVRRYGLVWWGVGALLLLLVVGASRVVALRWSDLALAVVMLGNWALAFWAGYQRGGVMAWREINKMLHDAGFEEPRR